MSDENPGTQIIVKVDDSTGRAAQAPAFINGKRVDYPINTPFAASDELLAGLKDSDMTVEVLPEGGSEPAVPAAAATEGAAEDHGGAGGATPTEGAEPALEPEGEPVEPVEPVEPETADETPATDPLDHDGDGKKGGSLPKRRRKPAAE